MYLVYPEKGERYPDWTLMGGPRWWYLQPGEEPPADCAAFWDSFEDIWCIPWGPIGEGYAPILIDEKTWARYKRVTQAYNEMQREISNLVYGKQS